jgi:hypothetical protein
MAFVVDQYKSKIPKVDPNLPQERKSLSAEINWGVRFQADSEVAQFIRDLALEVCGTLLTKAGWVLVRTLCGPEVVQCCGAFVSRKKRCLQRPIVYIH